jgi:hypothetical protein
VRDASRLRHGFHRLSWAAPKEAITATTATTQGRPGHTILSSLARRSYTPLRVGVNDAEGPPKTRPFVLEGLAWGGARPIQRKRRRVRHEIGPSIRRSQKRARRRCSRRRSRWRLARA